MDLIFGGIDTGTATVAVELYRDLDGDGQVSGGDTQVGTTDTDASGDYEFVVAETCAFVLQIDPGDLPAESVFTTDDVEVADFGTVYGLVDSGNGFGWYIPDDLAVTKTVDPSGPVDPGSTVTYTVSVTNSSATTNTNIDVDDVLPAGATFVAGSTQVHRLALTRSRQVARVTGPVVSPGMPRWTWNRVEWQPGRCVLIDVDGVIADGWHRQHYLDGPRKRWQDFFRAATEDPPLLPGITFVDLIDDATIVVLVTARPESIHDDTLTWLATHEIRWDLLIMRSRADHGPPPEMKRLAVEELRYAGFSPVLAVDDDLRNIAMYEEETIPALYVHSGYYEA